MTKNVDQQNQHPVNILLVDDSPQNLLAMAELLRAPDYNLVKAGSGAEALRHLLKMDFAVILLDIQMPGMDGFETAALIRERAKTKHTPIIFVSGVEKRAENVEKGYSLGAVDYLFKPIAPSFLKTKVSVFVELYQKKELEKKAAALFEKNELEKKANKHLALLAEELAKSNAELEQFAYIASHDLQEPLRKIKSFTELLSKRYQGKLDEKADEFIYYITDGAERMQRLISGLLTYSRITTQGNPLEPVDFNRLMQQVRNMIQMKIEETKTVLKVGNLPVLKVDAIQMGRVFQNFILNAIKFNVEKSPIIHVSAKQIEESQNKIWKFSIQDNGIGIDPVQSERIFRIFQRLHAKGQYPGEGMGLAICKKIVERHGGRIWVESDGQGKGTTFCFTLSSGD